MNLHGVLIISEIIEPPKFMAEVVSVNEQGKMTDDFSAETSWKQNASEAVMTMTDLINTYDNHIEWDLELRTVRGELTGMVVGSKERPQG